MVSQLNFGYSQSHRRRSLRLSSHDYSEAGSYFVTIVTQGRLCLFGKVSDSDIELNEAGEMVSRVWNGLPDRFSNISVDDFIVIPNHIHGIVDIYGVGASLVGALSAKETGATTRVAPTLGEVIGAFKSLTTVEYSRLVRSEGWPVFNGRLWQRNYFEHIVRGSQSRERILDYILGNPENWATDYENPSRLT